MARRMHPDEDNMALRLETPGTKRDARAVKILAKTIYKELRTSGLDEKEVMSLAGELLGLVSSEVRSRQVLSHRGSRTSVLAAAAPQKKQASCLPSACAHWLGFAPYVLSCLLIGQLFSSRPAPFLLEQVSLPVRLPDPQEFPSWK